MDTGGDEETQLIDNNGSRQQESDMREEFEEDLQDIYINHAYSNMELMAKK